MSNHVTSCQIPFILTLTEATNRDDRKLIPRIQNNAETHVERLLRRISCFSNDFQMAFRLKSRCDTWIEMHRTPAAATKRRNSTMLLLEQQEAKRASPDRCREQRSITAMLNLFILFQFLAAKNIQECLDMSRFSRCQDVHVLNMQIWCRFDVDLMRKEGSLV